MVPELSIPKDAEANEQVYKLTTRVHDACIELAKVQLELNLQIADLQLKAQPSTPSEVKEQCATTVRETIAVVDSAVADCTGLFKQSFEVLKSMQEDPNVQQLEIDVKILARKPPSSTYMTATSAVHCVAACFTTSTNCFVASPELSA